MSTATPLPDFIRTYGWRSSPLANIASVRDGCSIPTLLDQFKSLLHQGPHPQEDYERALVMSAQNNYVEYFTALLPFCKTDHHVALMWAARKDHREIALALLPHCSPEQIQQVVDLLVPQHPGQQVLREIAALVQRDQLHQSIEQDGGCIPGSRPRKI